MTPSLKQYYLDAGPGIITGGGPNTRRYTVGEEPDFAKYEEVTLTESRVWVGLTLDAARGQALLNEQPRLENGERDQNAIYSWSYREDQRVLGSYVLQRDYEKKITTAVEFAPTPNLSDAPQLSPGGRTTIQHATDEGLFPGDVTISKSNSSARLYYRVRVAQRTGIDNGTRFGAEFQSSAFSETSGNNVVVSIDAPETPATYIRVANETTDWFGRFRRVVRVDAYEQITQTNTATGEPVTVTSPTVTRYYHSEALTVLKPTLANSPAGRSSMQNVADFHDGHGQQQQPPLPTLPYTITFTTTEGTIEASGDRAQGGSGQFSVTWPNTAFTTRNSATIPADLTRSPRVLTEQGSFTYRAIFRIRVRAVITGSAGTFTSSTRTRYFHSTGTYGP